MNRNKLIGIAVIGGGLVWYMNSQSSTLPAVTTTTNTIANTDGSTTTTNDDGSTTTTNTDGSTTTNNTDGSTTTTDSDGSVTTTDADGTVIETTETPEIDTTEGSDDANTTADCSKYRASQHEKKKVWMSSAKVKKWDDQTNRPRGIKMDDFTTSQEQYFINQEVDWSLKLSVKNTSKNQCGKTWAGTSAKCWLPPGKDGGAYGNDCCLKWTVTWTNPQGETYVDDSGTITRPDIKPKDGGPVWSTLNGKFRIPNVESSEGTWDVAIKYWWNDDNFKPMPSVSWEGQVYSVVPESCGALAEQAAETYKSEFTRPVFRPRISRQSFMQF